MCDCNNQNKNCQEDVEMGTIYKYTNLINGKIYIGKTRRPLEQRIQEHYYTKKNSGLEGAIKKYGIENFKIDVVEKCPIDKLNEREIYYIAFYDCKAPKGYNLTDGGDSGFNLCFETRAQMSVAKNSDEFRKIMSAIHKGKPLSQQHKKNISASLKGRNLSDEHRKKLSVAAKGKQFSDSHKANISAAKKGKPLSKKNREGISAALKGRHLSEEHKKNLSLAKKGKKGTPHSEETKAKMSASRKAYLAKKKAEKNLENLES